MLGGIPQPVHNAVRKSTNEFPIVPPRIPPAPDGHAAEGGIGNVGSAGEDGEEAIVMREHLVLIVVNYRLVPLQSRVDIDASHLARNNLDWVGR